MFLPARCEAVLMPPVAVPAVACVLLSLPAGPLSGDAAAGRAVSAAVPLLARAAAGHVEQKSCFGCHNQAFPTLALAAARDRGYPVPPGHFAEQAEHVAAFLAANRERFRSGKGTGGHVDTAGYALLTLELAGHAPDGSTEAVAEFLLTFHADRGRWQVTSDRPPSEASDFTTTYLALRGLRVWATAGQRERAAARADAARRWLLSATPRDTEDRVFRLLGLKEAGAPADAVTAAAADLLATQRPGGGWGQKADMAPDAYATGTALVALNWAGRVTADQPAYRAGVGYLLRAQLSDGSWRVKSRSKPFQPYYEGGFPHGKDQFLSSTASGWAATAVLLGSPPRPAALDGSARQP